MDNTGVARLGVLIIILGTLFYIEKFYLKKLFEFHNHFPYTAKDWRKVLRKIVMILFFEILILRRNAYIYILLSIE